MPPPTLGDPWLTSRRFGIVVDAGSSGSRLQVYSWTDARAAQDGLLSGGGDLALLDDLPRVEKGVQSGEGWMRKVEPGLSSFGNDPTGVWDYLQPMLDHAEDIIPPSLHRDTPIFVLATAGMRLLSKPQQDAIIEATCSFFRANSQFKLDTASNYGPCGSSIRIISGEEEGIFGWIAVNYLMNGFASHEEQHRATYGFLDMGGASTQIAFEPSVSEMANLSAATADSLVEVRLRLLGGEEILHKVFVTTWLGYGTNQARERYLGSQAQAWEAETSKESHSASEVIPDACLPKNLEVEAAAVFSSSKTTPSRSDERKNLKFIGTGDFTQCVKKTAPLLNKDVACPDTSCLFNGVPAPAIDFSLSKFIGVSEYWYSSEHVFGLGGAYDYVQYERAATAFCARDWTDIVAEHNRTRIPAGINDNVSEDGKSFQWGPDVGLNRLQTQCFKAAWIVNMLHEGIGMPRIVDPGGNKTEGGVSSVVEEIAEDKGLGKDPLPPTPLLPPTFQSVDTIGDTAISWTLGKMVLEASKEVPVNPVHSHLPPLADPDPHGLSSKPSLESGGRPPSSWQDHLNSVHYSFSSKPILPLMLIVMIGCLYILLRFLFRLRRRIILKQRARRRDGSESRDREEMIGLFDVSEETGNGYGFSSSSSDGGSLPNTPHPPSSPHRSGFLQSITRLLGLNSDVRTHGLLSLSSASRSKRNRDRAKSKSISRSPLNRHSSYPQGSFRSASARQSGSRGSNSGIVFNAPPPPRLHFSNPSTSSNDGYPSDGVRSVSAKANFMGGSQVGSRVGSRRNSGSGSSLAGLTTRPAARSTSSLLPSLSALNTNITSVSPTGTSAQSSSRHSPLRAFPITTTNRSSSRISSSGDEDSYTYTHEKNGLQNVDLHADDGYQYNYDDEEILNTARPSSRIAGLVNYDRDLSRNSSQVNLTTASPRTVTLSRTASFELL